MDKPSNPDRIYEPEANEAQLTFRAVITGCLLGSDHDCTFVHTVGTVPVVRWWRP